MLGLLLTLVEHCAITEAEIIHGKWSHGNAFRQAVQFMFHVADWCDVILVFSVSDSFLHHYSESCILICPHSTTQRVPAASPSAHSISATTPDRTRFPRGSSSRSTFHGEQLRERRSAAYNGPPASPSHETGAFAHARRGTSTGIISKITSRFVRRSVPMYRGVWCPLGIIKETGFFSLILIVIFPKWFHDLLLELYFL